jgi:hypothetical protein
LPQWTTRTRFNLTSEEAEHTWQYIARDKEASYSILLSYVADMQMKLVAALLALSLPLALAAPTRMNHIYPIFGFCFTDYYV